MKKRLICMLLTVLMIVSVFAGNALSANAETVSYSTMTYRMASGDYVLRICQKLGLNYYVCKNAIMKLNNINENQWRYLPVGKLLTLPSTDADAVVITTGHGSTASTATTTPVATVAATSTTTTTTSSSTTTKTNTHPMANDVCWWYLTPYRLGAGETVVDACNALGVSFWQFSDTIQKVNKIKNWSNISAGTEIWIPSISMPAPGTNCIIIMAHDMAQGETAYGVVTERGLNYNAIKPLLQIVNEKYPDLAKIPAGVKFFYPVSYTVPLQEEIHGYLDLGTATNPKYKLNSAIETGAASVEFYIGNSRVYTAAAGETVKVVINAAADRAVKDVVIKHANGQADLYLNSASFVMPKCDITVDATFIKGHKIEVVSNYLDKALTLVDGVAVNSAAKGAAVLVSSADPTLAVDELYVSYMTYSGLKREKVTNIDDGFVMPDVDVKVEVVLKPLPTFALFVRDAQNGTFTLQVDGGDVTRAARGAQVSVAPKPSTGYTVGAIQFFDPVTGAVDNTIGMFNNTFTMPARDVGVAVTFVGRANNILMNPVEGGAFWATAQDVNGNWVQTREAQTGRVVRLASQAEAGWQASTNPSDYIVTRNVDGLRVRVTVAGDGTVSFTMPAGGVTVTGKFVGINQNLSYTAFVFLDNLAIPANTFRGVSFYTKGDNAQLRAEFQDGATGTPVAPAALAGAAVPAQLGEYINLSYDGGNNIVLDHYDILVNGQIDQTLTNEARINGCFQMPNNNVVINAYFCADKVKVAAADLNVIGSGTVGMVDQNGNSIDGVKVGEPFSISVSPSEGYFFNNAPADGKARLRVFRKDNGGEILPDPAVVPNPRQTLNADGNPTGEFVFSYPSMPDCGITVEATFDEIAYVLQLRAEDEAGNALNAAGLWKLTINDVDNVVENNLSTVNAAINDTVVIGLTDAGDSKYTFVRSIINGVNSTNTSFTISGDLARVPNRIIPVTIVLKSRAQGAWGNPFDLGAVVNYSERGSVGFTIAQASATYQRAVDPSAYVTKAYAGDTVAIFPKAVTPAQYYTDADHIRIYLGWGDEWIEPTGPVDANGDGKAEEYTFVMPEEGYNWIAVDFIPVEYNLTVNAATVNGGKTPAKGLFQVTYEDWSTNSDVLLATSFEQVPFGSTVTVSLTDAGRSAGVTIDIANTTITPTVDKEPSTGYSDAFSFTMPAAATTVSVKLANAENPPADDKVPLEVVPPTPATTTLPATSTDGKNLTYYKDAAMTQVIANPVEVTEGDVVYVKLDPSALNPGETVESLTFQDAGGDPVNTVGSDGKVVVKGTEKKLEVAVAKKQFNLKVNVANAPADLTSITINGSSIPVGGTYSSVEYGKTVTLKVDGSSDIISVDGFGATAPTISSDKRSASGAFEPDAEDGATVTVTINFQKKYKIKVNLVNAEASDSVTVEGTVISASGTMVEYDHFVDTDTVNFTAATRKIKSVEGLKSFTLNADEKSGVGYMQAYETDTVTVTVTFKPDACVLLAGKGVKYFKTAACASADEVTGTAEKGYTVYVKVDPLADDEYVKSVKITDADSKVTTLTGDAQSYTMSSDITNVEVVTAKKIVKVKLVVSGGPDSAECKISSDKVNWMPAQLSNMKSGSPVYIQAAFAKIVSVTEETGAFGTSLSKDDDTNASGTLKLPATAKDGDTIIVKVVLTDP